jgi:2-polyprenyl-6-methoxyphenol hydroxylase-like FAD-dependent oxidoreductase
MSHAHILIIGAGITGLTLAQALKKRNVRFTIFERDPNRLHRGKGWGLTVHWALDTFCSLLPDHLVHCLPETFVNSEATRKGENGNFIFFDLRSGQARWKVPPNKRIRVSRERLRGLLLEGIDVQVSTIYFRSPLLPRIEVPPGGG